MKAVYLAGPMRGIPFFNFPAFDEAAKRGHALGFIITSPAEHDREVGLDETLYPTGDIQQAEQDGFNLKASLDWDLSTIREQQAIALLPGWEKSVGAQAELAVARLYGLEVLDARNFLPLQQETRVISDTGGQKGVKLARFDLIPSDFLDELAQVFGRGAEKYEARNWERGYAWGLNIGALQRHLHAWLRGEQRDELGNHHLAQVAWHAAALYSFEKFNLGTDDRSTLGRK